MTDDHDQRIANLLEALKHLFKLPSSGVPAEPSIGQEAAFPEVAPLGLRGKDRHVNFRDEEDTREYDSSSPVTKEWIEKAHEYFPRDSFSPVPPLQQTENVTRKLNNIPDSLTEKEKSARKMAIWYEARTAKMENDLKELLKKFGDTVISYESVFFELMRIVFHYVKNEKEIVSYVSRTILEKLCIVHLTSDKQKAVVGSDDSVAFQHMKKVCMLLKTVSNNSSDSNEE